MKCPKIRFDEAEVIFLTESERADDWYSQVLKRIIERSLGSYYERDLSRELMYAFDPMSAWQVAAYHYRLFQEKVHQEMPGWINRVVEDDAAAALCYRRLCRKHERLCDYREMLAGVGWYHWRMRSELRRAIRQILSEEIDLLDFLNVVLYLSRRRLWGNHLINLRQIA